jgi:protein associated with RNAse G/E
MSNLTSNATWKILSLKYDQKPHYTWPANFIEDDGERLYLRSVLGGVLTHYTRGFEEPQKLPSDLTFWRDRWYNVFVNYDADYSIRNFYCNVGMPPIIASNLVTFVDLDLDVRVYPDGSYDLLDEDEFAVHRVHYNYPEWVQQRAWQAVDEIIALAAAHEGPFQLIKG